VQPVLTAFLAADELDVLSTLRDEITTIDRQEAAELSAVVQTWSDLQAVANLLFYPELIPRPDRLPSLVRGLASGDEGYLALAAVVGLQRVPEDEIPLAERLVIAEHLVRLVEHGPGPTPARASLTLADFAQDLQPAVLLRLLDHPDPVVRHNLVVALLSGFGLARVLATADAEVAAGDLSASAASTLRDSLVEAGLDPDDAFLDDDEVLASPLGLPLLSYIPNYADWAS
jgi:hypothetical protein